MEETSDGIFIGKICALSELIMEGGRQWGYERYYVGDHYTCQTLLNLIYCI